MQWYCRNWLCSPFLQRPRALGRPHPFSLRCSPVDHQHQPYRCPCVLYDMAPSAIREQHCSKTGSFRHCPRPRHGRETFSRYQHPLDGAGLDSHPCESQSRRQNPNAIRLNTSEYGHETDRHALQIDRAFGGFDVHISRWFRKNSGRRGGIYKHNELGS